MISPKAFNVADRIKRVHNLESEIDAIEEALNAKIAERDGIKAENTRSIKISLKDSIFSSLEVDIPKRDMDVFFLKTPSFLSECVAWNNGINVTRDLKNKIASTLSFMYGKREVGRFTKGSKSYYGLPKYFVDGERLDELRPEFQELFKEII